jgi:hypothetical protein
VNASLEPARAASPALPRSGPGAPGRSPQEIRADIERTRQELGGSVELLRRRVGELTDWRRQVSEHRTQIATGAAVAGFLVGGYLAMRRRRRRP